MSPLRHILLIALFVGALGPHASSQQPGADATGELLRVAAHNKLGRVLFQKREYDEAIKEFSESLRLRQNQAPTLVCRAKAYGKTGRFEKMLQDYSAALRFDPDDHEICDALAWQLATCPDPLIRDGPKALDLARKACELSKNEIPWYLDTLAAAHAELDQFAEAARVLEKLLDSPGDLSDAQLNNILLRLEQYEDGRPTRTIEPAPAGSDFALKVILPAHAELRLISARAADDLPASFATIGLPVAKAVKTVLQWKAPTAEAKDATVKVQLQFAVNNRVETLHLEYRLKRGQTRWVDARLIVDQWRRTVELLERLP
jgi:Tetratricopeptide repeat